MTYNGNAVPGAQVVALQAGHRPAFGVTDPSGDYSINVTGGTWTLTVHAHGYDTSGVAPVTAPALTQTNTSDTGVNIDISSAVQRNITLSAPWTRAVSRSPGRRSPPRCPGPSTASGR